MSNGSIAFPIAGNPPEKCPEGYVKDPKDPFICLPDVPCKHRQDKVVEGCCRLIRGMYCNHFQEEIHINRCKTCDSRVIPEGDGDSDNH